jgi:ribosome-associated protein
MDVTLQADNDLFSDAVSLGRLLAEHKGEDAAVLDLRNISTWTDFFVIATATSSTHLAGLERQVQEFAREKKRTILRISKKTAAIEEEWKLIDMGTIVVHLMTAKARSFYELERLWSKAVSVTL